MKTGEPDLQRRRSSKRRGKVAGEQQEDDYQKDMSSSDKEVEISGDSGLMVWRKDGCVLLLGRILYPLLTIVLRSITYLSQ